MKSARNRESILRTQRIKTVCRGFEQDWQSEAQPRIEDYLGSAAGQDRAELLAALLSLEVRLLAQQGSAATAEAYQSRFPHDSDLVAEVFAEAAAASAGGLTYSLNDSPLPSPTQPYLGESLETLDPPSVADRESTLRAATGSRDTSISRQPGAPPSDLLETQDAPSAREPGLQIGRFQILQLLGQGAFGKVYRAHDPQLAREVAIKVPVRETLQTEAEVQRFLGEARAAATIRHPNICPVYEVGQDGNQYFIVLAFVEGKSLAAVLDERAGLLPIREAVQIVRTLAAAMAVAHGKGIVHRDLKPANVMFDRDSGEAVIMDFGLARRREPGDAGQTQEGMILGTPAYMPPEQASGKVEAVGPHSDIYSLGVILYELLCGQRPFTGTPFEILGKVQYVVPPPPSKHRKALDPRLESICLKAMAKEPARRFSSMKSFADTLGQYLELASTEVAVQPEAAASETAEVETTRARKRPPPWQWLAGAGVLAALLVLGIIYFVRTPSTALISGIDGGTTSTQPDLRVAKGDTSLKGEPPAKNEPGKAAPSAAEGWVQLFNGRDLTGWKTHPNQPGNWRVENFALVGRGPKQSHLYSERGDYEDFHFRVSAKINSGGNSGQQFRKEFNGDNTRGYEAQIDNSKHPAKTGSLYLGTGTGRPEVAVWNTLVPVDTWFTQEVIAQGNRIIIKVNDVTTVDFVDQNNTWKRGHFALQVWDPPTVVHFRKIEVKELKASQTATPPPAEPAWVQLFNGKDLTGWKPNPGSSAHWSIQNGRLVGNGPLGYLFSERGDYENFHFRVEAAINDRGNSGQFFRTQFPAAPLSPNEFLKGYEAQINATHSDPQRTGSLHSIAPVMEALHKPDEWFTQEVIAEGQRLRVLVNGKQVVDTTQTRYTKGHFALQQVGPKSVVQFRKVEVKELK
ncbi:MAG: DUF1080 domain-containing protein [Planctomycetia bacterium]|nr:DUF1080 domain-containing protein [Planctomycetia bacterium]